MNSDFAAMMKAVRSPNRFMEIALVTLVATLLLVSSPGDLRGQADGPTYVDSLEQLLDRRDSTVSSCHFRISIDSTDEDAWLSLYAIAKERNYYDSTLLYAQRCARLVGGHDCHAILGDALLDNGLIRDAIIALDRAISFDPNAVRTMTMISEAYDLLDLTDSALIYIDSAIALNPRFVQAHYQRADLLDRIGRYADAIESYRSWANLQPFAAEPWTKLGAALWAIGSYEEAITTLEYSLGLDDSSPETLFLIAASKQALGRTAEARDEYVELFFTFPNHRRAVDAEQRARELGWDPARSSD